MDSPDIVLILADDLGFSDIGSYGGEIDTPTLDGLARGGTRMTQFYNTARCSPSRASLLTGLHPHQVGVGVLDSDDRPEGYPGSLTEDCVTIAEALRGAGYATYMTGKWHLTNDTSEPNGAWPTRRGFDRYYGALEPISYYQPARLTRDEESVDHEALEPRFFLTDAIGDRACEFIEEHDRDHGERPYFLYMAFSAPHWPLHAPEEDVEKYRGRFDSGWERLREERLQRLIAEGLVRPDSALSERDPEVPSWNGVEERTWEARRMEVYAAQVERMDRAIGRVLERLERLGRLDNTMVVFLSDNGGAAEELAPEAFERLRGLPAEALSGSLRAMLRVTSGLVAGNVPGVMPGPPSTYQSYGRAWANLSNTPFREYKCWVHEGGIATPLIIRWPAGLPDAGRLCTVPAQLTDVMPTLLEAAGARHPDNRGGRPVPPTEGRSLLSALRGRDASERTLFWEHEGNCAVRRDSWKLVKKYGQAWELFDIDADRAERNDLSSRHPQLVAEFADAYAAWASRCGVLPYERTLENYRRRGLLP